MWEEIKWIEQLGDELRGIKWLGAHEKAEETKKKAINLESEKCQKISNSIAAEKVWNPVFVLDFWR